MWPVLSLPFCQWHEVHVMFNPSVWATLVQLTESSRHLWSEWAHLHECTVYSCMWMHVHVCFVCCRENLRFCWIKQQNNSGVPGVQTGSQERPRFRHRCVYSEERGCVCDCGGGRWGWVSLWMVAKFTSQPPPPPHLGLDSSSQQQGLHARRESADSRERTHVEE